MKQSDEIVLVAELANFTAHHNILYGHLKTAQ